MYIRFQFPHTPNSHMAESTNDACACANVSNAISHHSIYVLCIYSASADH